MKIRVQILGFIYVFFISVSVFAIAKRKPIPTLPPREKSEVTYSEKALVRTDPHGTKNIKPTIEQAKEANECLVCHAFEKSKFVTKSNALESCFNCHNRGPHSGVAEHLSHKVTCTDCHTFHRGDSITWKPSSGAFKNLRDKALVPDLVEKNAGSAMLKKNCTDCHQ